MLKSTMRILAELDIFTKTPIKENDITEENKAYVIKNGPSEFYQVNTHDFTDEDIKLQLMAQQTLYLSYINNILKVLLAIFIIPIFIYILTLFISL